MEKPDITSVELLPVEGDMPDIDWSALNDCDSDDPNVPSKSSSTSRLRNSFSAPLHTRRSQQLIPRPSSSAPSSRRNRDHKPHLSTAQPFSNETINEHQRQHNSPYAIAEHPPDKIDHFPSDSAHDANRYFHPKSKRQDKRLRKRKRPTSTGSTKISCDLCGIFVTGEKTLEAHQKGKNHRRKVREQKWEPINKQLEILHREDLPPPRLKPPPPPSNQHPHLKTTSPPDLASTPQTAGPLLANRLNSDNPAPRASTSALPMPSRPTDNGTSKLSAKSLRFASKSGDATADPTAISVSASRKRPSEYSDSWDAVISERESKRPRSISANSPPISPAGGTPAAAQHTLPKPAAASSNASFPSIPLAIKVATPRAPESARIVADKTHQPDDSINDSTANSESHRHVPVANITSSEPASSRMRSEPVSPRIRSEPLSHRWLNEPVSPRLRDEPLSPRFRSQPVSTRLRSTPTSEPVPVGQRVRATPIPNRHPDSAKSSELITGSDGMPRGDQKASATGKTWIKPVLWDPYIRQFDPSQVGEKGILISDDFQKEKMTMSEWRELRHVVYQKGDDVDKLAFKLMQELILSPTLGISKDSLPALNRAMQNNCSAQYYSKETGSYMRKSDLPEKLWVREPRFVESDPKWMKKQTPEDLSLHLACENIHYALFQAEDYEDVKHKAPIAALPLRGRVTGFRSAGTNVMGLDGGRSDSLESDDLFRRIREYKLAKSEQGKLFANKEQ